MVIRGNSCFKVLGILLTIFICSAFVTDCNNKFETNYIPYYLKVYEADSLYLINDFEGSYRLLDSLFKVYKPLNIDNFAEYGIYVTSAVKSGNLDGIKQKVEYGYKTFGEIKTIHRNSYELHEEVNRVVGLSDKEIKDLKEIYYRNLDLELRAKLLKMFKEDQEARTVSVNQEKIDLVDQNNRKEIDAIFEKYGFPLKSMTGSMNAYDLPGGYFRLVIFFLHQPDDFKQKYLPILLDNVKKGNIEPDVYTSVYDKRLIENKKNQYFGTFWCSEDMLCQLENPKEIDSIRRSVGLPHTTYYAWRMDQIRD